MNNKNLIRYLAVCVLLCATGCHSYGPKSIIPDRFDYSAALAQSWKNQLVQNLVRMRYGGTPHFVEVSGILSQYSINTEAIGGFRVNADGVAGVTEVPFSISGSFTESPTITYTPLVGEDFTERLLTPIDPVTIIYIAQAGWPIDHLLELCVDQINGLRNHTIVSSNNIESTKAQAQDSEFVELVTLLKALQSQGMLDIRVEQSGRKLTLFLPPTKGTEAQNKMTMRLREILNLSQTDSEFILIQSSIQRSMDEIAMQTRSLLTMLISLSSAVEAPELHMEQNIVYEEALMRMPPSAKEKLLEIGSSKKPVKNVFVQIKYRNHYYYVKDEDEGSKRTLALITYLFNLQSRESGQMAPLITVPAAAPR